jgi:hypothetical protein
LQGRIVLRLFSAAVALGGIASVALALIWALKADSTIYAFTRILGTGYGIK